MSKIRIDANAAVLAGKQFTFKAPCNPDNVDGLLINGVTYTICDALGNSLCKKANAWKSGTLVSVIIDTDTKQAFILNSPKALGTSPDDIGAAKKVHNHALTDSTITGTLPINKGGTAATTAADALVKLGAASEGHSHGLDSEKITGILGIPKGGTGAANIPDARRNLGIVTGSYTGGSTFTSTIAGAYSNFIFIWCASKEYKGFLTPGGGLMYGRTATDTHKYFVRNASGGLSGETEAYYESGVLYMHTDNRLINESNQVFNYICF